MGQRVPQIVGKSRKFPDHGKICIRTGKRISFTEYDPAVVQRKPHCLCLEYIYSDVKHPEYLEIS